MGSVFPLQQVHTHLCFWRLRNTIGAYLSAYFLSVVRLESHIRRTMINFSFWKGKGTLRSLANILPRTRWLWGVLAFSAALRICFSAWFTGKLNGRPRVESNGMLDGNIFNLKRPEEYEYEESFLLSPCSSRAFNTGIWKLSLHRVFFPRLAANCILFFGWLFILKIDPIWIS